MADIKKDAERLVNYVSALEQQGGLFLSKPQDVIPPTAGLFEKSFPLWEADKEYKKNDLFSYNGCVGYVKQPSLTSGNLSTIQYRYRVFIWRKTKTGYRRYLSLCV